METPEGKGIAKRAWEAYAGVIQKTIYRPLAPFLDPMNESLSCQVVEDLLGFWVMWHLYGGFEGLERFGMHRSTIWRKVARFRRVIGVHPDEYEMPGITIDPGQYWSSSVRKVGRQP
jgi:hypothetical protein